MPKLISRAAMQGASALSLCAALFLTACTPGADLPDMPPYAQNGYRLGGGDQVRVITFGVDQLSGQFRVDDQGNIAMPLVGDVHAAGSTPADLAALLTGKLRRQKFVRDPSVSVEVLSYRPIFVLGEVSRPGQYPFSPGMTMLTAVAVAGGFTYRAVEAYASDVRTIDGHAVTGKVMPSSFLAPGDVVKVYERHF
jgi:polysaccharide export outer membrane protein